VTVNTDNRLITDTTVTRELSILARQFSLTAQDVRNVLVAGCKSAFLTFHDRAQLIRRVQREIDDTLGRFAAQAGKGAGGSSGPKAAPATGAPAARPGA
jgi:adenosine deaminase